MSTSITKAELKDKLTKNTVCLLDDGNADRRQIKRIGKKKAVVG